MDRRDGVQTQVVHQQNRIVGQPPTRYQGWLHVLGGLMLLLAVFVMLGSVTPAYADVVQCGAVLGPGGRVTLEQDIACPLSDNSPSVTVRDGAILDLNGHTVTCRSTCVLLTGKGAKLLNGTVKGHNHDSIALNGTGRHTVRNVTSLGPVDGNVHVDSDHNTLIDVMAESVISAAFAIAGHHNLLANSIALCPQVESCIFVGGDGNRVIDNFVRAESDSRALVVTGDNNVVQGNRLILTGFLLHGLIVSGTGNRLTGNTAITEDGVDLVDVNGDCAHNTWRHNIFVTREPACIK